MVNKLFCYPRFLSSFATGHSYCLTCQMGQMIERPSSAGFNRELQIIIREYNIHFFNLE